jgi:Amt family ammonium transporter
MMKGMLGNATWKLAPTIPLVLFAMFQLKFAVITPALITGAFAERIRFNSYIIFLCLFMIVIYAPLAHSTWHPDGFLFKLGVLDFAGGTVVHMSAGWAALASALYLKQRNEKAHSPARISYVLLGTGLLWFGWFGFNAGFGHYHNSICSGSNIVDLF